MEFVRIVTFILLAVGVFGVNMDLTRLIEKIYQQCDSSTVYFIGMNESFLSEFMSTHSDMPLSIFKTVSAEFNQTLKSAAVLVAQVPSEKSDFTELLQRIIQTFRTRKFVIVSAANFKHMREYFSYFEANKFTRIFGVIGGKSFAYLNYASIPVQELAFEDPLPDALKNLNGFKLRTTVQKDIPRVFWYPDKRGKLQIGGCFGRLFVNFLRRHNAELQEVILNNRTKLFMPSVINATLNNEIDVSMNVWGSNTGLVSSYPAKLIRYTVMVPLNGNLDPNEYFLRPFSTTVWLLIGLTLTYIVLMDYAKDKYIRSTANIWNNFSRTLMAMLNASHHTPSQDYRFHSQVLLLAFVLSNLYIIHFTSFLTAFIKIRQYETKKDLIDNNVRVMIPYFEWKVVERPQLKAIGFDKIIVTVDYPVYITAVNSMANTKYAYAIGSDRASFLIGMQKVFAKPLFHLANDELFSTQLGYLLPPHSPFKEILSDFIHKVLNVGLIEKWDSDAVPQALRTGFQIQVDRKTGALHTPLKIYHLAFAWNLLLGGLSLASIVFLWEKFCKVFQNRSLKVLN